MMIFFLLVFFGTREYYIEGQKVAFSSPPLVNLSYKWFQLPKGYLLKIEAKPLSPYLKLPFTQDLLDHIRRKTDRCTVAVEYFCQTLKSKGIPCQHVSGYLWARRLPAKATKYWDPRLKVLRHRWARIYLPSVGWIGVDPLGGGSHLSENYLPLQSIGLAEVSPWD